MKRLALVPLLFSSAVGVAAHEPASSDDMGLQNILVVGKFAGLCGVLDELVQFQKELQFANGEAFVTRFWLVMAAKQGMSVDALSERCDQVYDMYGVLFEAAESTDSD